MAVMVVAVKLSLLMAVPTSVHKILEKPGRLPLLEASCGTLAISTLLMPMAFLQRAGEPAIVLIRHQTTRESSYIIERRILPSGPGPPGILQTGFIYYMSWILLPGKTAHRILPR